MGRIYENEVPGVVETNDGYWELIETETGAPLAVGQVGAIPLTRTYLGQRLDDWQAKGAQIINAVEIQLPDLRAQRDEIWGVNASQMTGVWFMLGRYKAAVRAAAQANPTLRPFVRTCPALTDVSPKTIPNLFNDFILDWTEINTAMGITAPLSIGDFTLSDLQMAQVAWQAKQTAINNTKGTVERLRAERDDILGDQNGDLQLPNSLVGILKAFHFKVQTTTALQGYAANLPRIFPSRPNDNEVPNFGFNLRVAGANLVFWCTPPAGVDATHIWVKEGTQERSVALPNTPGMVKVTIPTIALTDGLDEAELRDGAAQTVANGVFDATITEPA